MDSEGLYGACNRTGINPVAVGTPTSDTANVNGTYFLTPIIAEEGTTDVFAVSEVRIPVMAFTPPYKSSVFEIQFLVSR
jgi:hypothetical protein